MKRVSIQTLIFSILALIFINGLVFFRIPFSPYPLMSIQDVLDIFTPLVLIPIYWLLFKSTSRSETTPRLEYIFLLFAALWVAGQSMHLGTNSINNLSEKLAEQNTIDILNSDIYTLTYFYDEYLSHFLWHIGILGLAILLIYHEWRNPSGQRTIWWAAILGGVIHGFTYFTAFLEGQTTPLSYPVSILITAYILIFGRKKLSDHPVTAFFLITFLVTVLFFSGWGLYWKGFPGIFESGLMK